MLVIFVDTLLPGVCQRVGAAQVTGLLLADQFREEHRPQFGYPPQADTGGEPQSVALSC